MCFNAIGSSLSLGLAREPVAISMPNFLCILTVMTTVDRNRHKSKKTTSGFEPPSLISSDDVITR
jgi:hypothetical protein